MEKAQRANSKLRIGISGPSGSGKTLTALRIAEAFKGDGRIGMIETELEGSEAYSPPPGKAADGVNIFDFDREKVEAPFNPKKLVEVLIKIEKAREHSVIIPDSLTPYWDGEGGVLDLVGNAGDNKYTAWKIPSALQNKMIWTLFAVNVHVIATIKAKQDHVLEKNAMGKTEVRKIGLGPIQRPGIESEFSLFFTLDQDCTLTVTKARDPKRVFKGRVFPLPGEEFVAALKGFVEGRV